MADKDKVFIFDTTMRDGEQSPGASMSVEEKIQISRTVTEFDDFKIGDQVQHNLFGIGTILVLSGTGENQKVGVEFDGGLRKKLIVKYARLKKID